MPLKITPAPIKEFHLARSDERYGDINLPTMIQVRKAMAGEEEARGKLFALVRQEIDDETGKLIYVSTVSTDDVHRREVYLTLVSCNINLENDQPLFRFRSENSIIRIAMTELEFDQAWNKLPYDIAYEIIECVEAQNPQWISD